MVIMVGGSVVFVIVVTIVLFFRLGFLFLFCFISDKFVIGVILSGFIVLCSDLRNL